MKNKLTKFICAVVMLIMSVGVLCACNKDDVFENKYNTTMYYGSVINDLNEEFLLANSTRGTEYQGQLLPDDTRPITNVQTICDEDEFDVAFKDFPSQINFEKEMLVLYFFSGSIIENLVSGEKIFEYQIKDMSLNDNDLNIVVTKKPLVEGPTGSPLTQECLIFKMDKLNIDSVKVKIIYL